MSWRSEFQSSADQEPVQASEAMGVDEFASHAPEGMPCRLAASSGDNPGSDSLGLGSMYLMVYAPDGGVQYTDTSFDDEDVDFAGGRTASADLTAVDNQYAARQQYALDYAAPTMNTKSWQPSYQRAASHLVDDTGYRSNTVYQNWQNDPILVGMHRTVSYSEPHYECRPPVRQRANDSTFPDQAQRFGANMQHDTLVPQMRMNNVLEHTGDMCSHSPPWNPLDLRGPQVAAGRTPFYGHATTPSQDLYAYNSASTLSSTTPSTATPSSRCHDMSESVLTIRPQLTPINLDQLGHESREGRSHFPVPGAVHRGAAGVAACLDRRGSRAIEIGAISGFVTVDILVVGVC